MTTCTYLLRTTNFTILKSTFLVIVFFIYIFVCIFIVSASAALLEAIDSIAILELTLAQIKGNLSEIFDVTIDSQLYTFNKSTLTVTSLIECRSGSVPNKGLCGKGKRFLFCIYIYIYILKI